MYTDTPGTRGHQRRYTFDTGNSRQQRCNDGQIEAFVVAHEKEETLVFVFFLITKQNVDNKSNNCFFYLNIIPSNNVI